MKNQATLRFATPSDVPELVELCGLHAAFEKADYDPNSKDTLLAQHLFSNPPSLYCLVVEKDGRLLGYATYMKQFSTWDAAYYIYMDCLFIREASRGMGLGERLIERIKQEAHALDCSLIQWQTPEFNTRAMKFYTRIGAHGKTKERFFLDVT